MDPRPLRGPAHPAEHPRQEDESRRERVLAGYLRRVMDAYARFKAQPAEGQTR
ncbi:MAG: hypothetical protein FJ086_12075 [Deltaproteobacteria bacterium]|nr:hypothetical protein [Deltaproteobacteria bacterium]